MLASPAHCTIHTSHMVSYMQSAECRPCRNPDACPTAVQSLVTLYVLTLHLYQCTCTRVCIVPVCHPTQSLGPSVTLCVHCTLHQHLYIYLYLYCVSHPSVTSHRTRDPWILPPLTLDAHFIIPMGSRIGGKLHFHNHTNTPDLLLVYVASQVLWHQRRHRDSA